MIPACEAEILINTVDTALRMARQGELADGHCELVYGLCRAEALASERAEWGQELVGRYQSAVQNCWEQWGVRMGEAGSPPSIDYHT